MVLVCCRDREKEAWSEGRKCLIVTENERVGMVEWRGPTQVKSLDFFPFFHWD